MDLSEIVKLLLGEAQSATPLVLLIVALVEFAKQFGVQGKWSLLTAMVLGILFGVGYKLSLGIPTNFEGIFSIIVFSLALGAAASGSFEILKGFRRDTTEQ